MRTQTWAKLDLEPLPFSIFNLNSLATYQQPFHPLAPKLKLPTPNSWSDI